MPVRDYLDRLHAIRATGDATPEISYREALLTLLRAVGETLDPAVSATDEVTDRGAGRPDLSLRTARANASRGVVETKSFGEPLAKTLASEQVARYVEHYGTVLVTNYRAFAVVTAAGVELRYSLADSEQQFWAADRAALAETHADSLTDYLAGALTRGADVTRPAELAADLARYARDARARLDAAPTDRLAELEAEMEEALGLSFGTDDAEDFFRSTLVQTLFYGLFSGWVLWFRETGGKANGTLPFDWREAGRFLPLPVVSDLYEEIGKPSRLNRLDLREPLEWAAESLARVKEGAFFASFDADHAITLFYEPFLKAFDPALRKELGVWYTPPEVVRYMVRRADAVLRDPDGLNIPDGLADPSVVVLDPAAGTGSYLVEVARTIRERLLEQGHGKQAGGLVRQALTGRVFGFELLTAPYVVAHLQLNLLLREFGAPLPDGDRCGVLLTNALTGWQREEGPSAKGGQHGMFADEAAAARAVKQSERVLVVLGNPPYNGYAGVAQDEEADLVAPYAEGREAFGAGGQGLADLYVRFFRLAERKIAADTGRGVVCLITNFSWLDGQSHPVMRRRLAAAFDELWIDGLNGDSFRTGKKVPPGLPGAGGTDQSVFTTDDEPIGIRVGTAISTLVKYEPGAGAGVVRHRDLWGTANAKRAALLASLDDPDPAALYERVEPDPELRYLFTPGAAAPGYATWPSLTDLFREQYPGVTTSRDELLVDIDRDSLEARMDRYFDPDVSDAAIEREARFSMAKRARFDPVKARRGLQDRGFLPKNVFPYAYRPFDDRWLYWEPKGKLLDEKRASYIPHAFAGNVALVASKAIRKGSYDPPFVADRLGSYHLNERGAAIFPLHLRPTTLGVEERHVNVRDDVLQTLCSWGGGGSPLFEPDGHTPTARASELAADLFAHVLAVLWSPAYRSENLAALRQNWPRVPLPADAADLARGAALGRRIENLLLSDRPADGVTVGTLAPRVRGVADLESLDGRPAESDLSITAGWGHEQVHAGRKTRSIMPGSGRVDPHPADPERAVDIYLSDRVRWSNVPRSAWGFTLGGYPVLKKWLSYREEKLLGRPLRPEEALHFTQTARRIVALRALEGELDAHYRATARGANAGENTEG